MSARTVAFALLLGLSTSVWADPPVPSNRPATKLVELPNLRLKPRPPLSKEKAAHIKALIARLAEVDRPDIGYSPTFGGFAFLPVPGHIQEDALTWTNHRLKSSQALHDLVATGPDALPFLLDALGDKTPTKLTLQHGRPNDVFREGATWFSNELGGNRLNPREAMLIDPPNRRLSDSKHIETYTVRVGDLCFVAIGQIVGRPYMAARYQMTACTVLNSPVEDPTFRDRIRKIWSSNNPTQTVFESLWTDYRTRGNTRPPETLGWNYGSRYQSEAALRLLYYFPEEFAPVIVDRLKKLDVSKAIEGEESFALRGVANGGVYADELLDAVAWSKESTVRAAVRDIFHRTADIQVFAASAKAFGPSEGEVIVKKASELLTGLMDEERKRGGERCVYGVAAAQARAAAAPLFRRAMEKAQPTELDSLIGALSEAEGGWPIALLKPLLDDTRATERVYFVQDKEKNLPPVAPPPPVGGPGGAKTAEDDGYRKVPVRVCDAAAETLANLLPGERANFPKEKDRSNMDRHISQLREKLAK